MIIFYPTPGKPKMNPGNISHSTTAGRAKILETGKTKGKTRDNRNEFNKALRDNDVHLKYECTCKDDYQCHVCYLREQREEMDKKGLSNLRRPRRTI